MLPTQNNNIYLVLFFNKINLLLIFITDWLIRTSEELIMKGKGEAFCKLCLSPLRAHKTDLKKHKKSKAHIERENAANIKKQPTLSSFGWYTNLMLDYFGTYIYTKLNLPISGSNISLMTCISGYSTTDKMEKSTDIQIAAHVACHGSVKSVDHMGELLKNIGKGSPLENLQLHKTKCSSIIKHIIEPCLKSELIREVIIRTPLSLMSRLMFHQKNTWLILYAITTTRKKP